MSEPTPQERNLVILSDGTGNRAGKGRGTNVWQLHEALDRTQRRKFQLAIHDDGVGSESNTLLATLGGAFGFGLARNVRELYAWLCTQYSPETDRIYLFGFSRGAFTVRCLSGIITKFGIFDGTSMPRSELQRWVQQVWFAFKRSQSRPDGEVDFDKYRPWGSRMLDRIRKKPPPKFFKKPVKIQFIGVWDTVDAYGLPVDELKEAFAWASLKVFRFWPLRYLAMTRFNDRKLSEHVLNAYHAVAIDDERHTFHPVLWDEGPPHRSHTIEQVWFSGMHSDVGGGYARRSLALVSLNWIMTQADKNGLEFDEGKWDGIRREANALGRMHDSRSGLSSFYRYRPRDIQELCKKHNIAKPNVHESVLQRVRGLHGEDAPGVLPENFDVKTDSGDDNPREVIRPDADCLNRLRKYHRKRRGLYFAFAAWAVALGGVLAAYWDQSSVLPAPAWGFLGFGYFLSLVEKVTPAMISGAVRTLRSAPFYTLVLALGLVVLSMTRSRLVGRIRELRRAAWNKEFRDELFKQRGWSPTTPNAEPVEAAPGAPVPKAYEKTLAARVVVLAFAAGIAIWVANWIRTGTLFPPNAVAESVRPEYGPIPDGYEFDFSTNNPGHRVGPVLRRGERYAISVEVVEPWRDDGLAASPTGLQGEPTFSMRLFSWTRRDWRHPWFALLGSLGSENGEKFLIGDGYEMKEPLSGDTRLNLYVNDATCYVCPTGPWKFYENNAGTARVTVRRLSN